MDKVTGDINDDGLVDMIVGSYQADPGGVSNAGSAHVILGKAGTTAVYLTDINAGNGGFSIHGISTDDEAGWDVSGGADVNGDGLLDLVIGASSAYNGADRTGAAYVVYGKKTTNSIQLSDIATGNGGFEIKGIANGDKTAWVGMGVISMVTDSAIF